MPPAANHGNLDGVEHFGEERQQAHRAAHMAARLHALRDDHVAIRLLGRDGFAHGADLPDRERTPRVQVIDERVVGLSVEEFHHASSACRHVDALEIEERDQQVDAVGLRSEPFDGVELLGQHRRRRHRRADRAEAAGVRDRGDQLGGADSRHSRELHGMATTDELRESGPEHGTSSSTSGDIAGSPTHAKERSGLSLPTNTRNFMKAEAR
jgi:hypothetical protein